jgi:3'-5' exonuclease
MSATRRRRILTTTFRSELHMNTNKLFLDIETLPPQGGDHFTRIRAGIKAPGQYKKPESIAEWLASNADALANEEVAKLGLDGLYGQVCVIGWAVNGEKVATLSLQDCPETGEAGLISLAFSVIQSASVDGSTSWRALSPVGHNIEFDIRFLMQRAVRYGISVPPCLRKAFDPDKGRYETFDTMKAWSGFKGWTKLKDMTRELFGDAGDDIDGADVASVWASDPAKVIEHCRQDVERVRRLYKAMALTLWGEAA